MISIHALREEGDKLDLPKRGLASDFYPRPPRGGRQSKTSSVSGPWIFLSTPSARRATPSPSRWPKLRTISIHALREEGDRQQLARLHMDREFLSTPSARRATQRGRGGATAGQHFYPRPPRGGRPARLWLMQPSWTNFYPRPPRGGRLGMRVVFRGRAKFLSTPSARRATPAQGILLFYRAYFYPRPPRGGRRLRCSAWYRPVEFLSTPSARRATPEHLQDS